MVGGERARPRNVRPHLPLVVDVVGRSGVRALPNAPDEWGISLRDLRRHGMSALGHERPKGDVRVGSVVVNSPASQSAALGQQKKEDLTVRQKRPRSSALRPSEAAMIQRPGVPAEAAFAVAPAPARCRSAETVTSRAGEKKATEAVLRNGASPELLPEMADQLWRANPLHRLLPISWGEITRALVKLSDRSTADPVHTTTVAANLGLTMWREAAEIWIGTAARWWGLAPAPARPEGTEADRRFDAPEWEQHPFFRLLKQSYLALSKQLLEEAERQAVDPDERQRLVFHVRQFLDAISPTTFLPTNPAALRKAWETRSSTVTASSSSSITRR